MQKTLKEQAQEYEPNQRGNIADLDKVSINLELQDGQGTDKEGTEFKYKFIIVEGKSYRVPGSVIGQVKAIIEKMPQLEFISVIKQGSGRDTRYQVIPQTEVHIEEVKPQ